MSVGLQRTCAHRLQNSSRAWFSRSMAGQALASRMFANSGVIVAARRPQVSCKIGACIIALLVVNTCLAETGYDAWLRYPLIDEAAKRELYQQLPKAVVVLSASPIGDSAKAEL